MRFKTRVLTATIAVAAVITSTVPLAGAVQRPDDRVVSANPENWTPHALDGDVKAIAQVGSTMVVGGNFTQVSSADGATVVNQPYVFAFDAVTGNLKQGFDPQIVGGEVNSIVAHPDGDKVWLGGAFSNVNGPTSKSLALVSLATGDAVSPFKAPAMNGRVVSMQLTAGRLLISGTWSSIGGTAQGYIASLNPASGAVVPFMSVAVTGVHNGGHTAVSKFDVTPDGTKLVAMGNFTHIDGQPRRQLAVLDLLGTRARVTDWHTARFEGLCTSASETYTRDIDVDPTGTYFVIVTAGAYGSGLMCDSASRWELGRRGSNQQPSWIDYTGGDTLWSVGITGEAVYVGGHQRWLNNPSASDSAGPGAVAREGIAALDPVNGLPLSWNPGRDRGVGAYELTGTDAGLWVGSDTDRIGRFEYHGRLAMFPRNGGVAVPESETGVLPGRLISIGTSTSDSVTVRNFNGAVTGQTTLPANGTAWRNLRGATMISGKLYHGGASGSWYMRTWDGSAFGAATVIPTNGLTAWSDDLRAMTGMFFQNGKLYFTRSDSSTLYSRYFTPESGIVGGQRFSESANVTGIDFLRVAGMTVAGNTSTGPTRWTGRCVAATSSTASRWPPPP